MSTPDPTVKRRVAVTGIGAVTALGYDFASTWSGVLGGVLPARRIDRFDASGFQTTFACQVAGFEDQGESMWAEDRGILSRASAFGLHAAEEAWNQSGLTAQQSDAQRRAVCLGVGMGTPDAHWYAKHFARGRVVFDQPGRTFGQTPAVLAQLLCRLIDAQGGGFSLHTACSSSAQAVGEAYEMIVAGDADVVLTGGADGMIEPIQLAGFSLLGALSRRNAEPATACRPFDVTRDGFVLGEGACMLVLEDLAHAEARGARILAELCGYGITSSAYRITDLDPKGEGPQRAMAWALRDADLCAADIGYVNAHGTATQMNDAVEATAIREVFGAVPTSSTKPMTGHLIAAAGALEGALVVQCLNDQMVPPSRNVFDQDPACPVDLTGPTARPAALRYAMTTSIGFGGSNAALVFGRYRAQGARDA